MEVEPDIAFKDVQGNLYSLHSLAQEIHAG